MENKQSVWDWAKELSDFHPAGLEQLPDIDLYMDQVITLLSKELAPFEAGEEKLLTSNMINNYVKGNVLPPPQKKKYSREHLSYLLMICRLKSVLSLPQIAKAMDGLTEQTDIWQVYADFRTKENQLAEEISGRILSIQEQSDYQKLIAAMEMAILANLSRCAAVRLLDDISVEVEEPSKKNKKKEK